MQEEQTVEILKNRTVLQSIDLTDQIPESQE